MGTDAHARNYSVLIHPGGRVTLAPLYDVASALLFPKQRVKLEAMNLAMSVGEVTTVGLIGRGAWEAQARAVRLKPERVLDEIRNLVSRVASGTHAVAARAAGEGIPETFLARFTRKVSARAAPCARELARGR